MLWEKFGKASDGNCVIITFRLCVPDGWLVFQVTESVTPPNRSVFISPISHYIDPKHTWQDSIEERLPKESVCD